jgi:hypothetical protein
MSKNNNGETFIGFAGLVFAAAILCAPVLGWTGILAGAAMIYFGLVLTNGADTAAKRGTKQKRR